MPIKFTSGKQFSTGSQTLTLNNTPQASICYFLRFDGTEAGSSGDFLFRQWASTYYNPFNGSAAPGTVRLHWEWSLSSGRVMTDQSIAIGSVYHIAVTHAQGSQIIYINGIAHPFGTSTGNTESNASPFLMGDPNANSNRIWTISDLAMWDGYVLTQQDVLDLRNGTKVPPDIGVGSTWRGRWTMSTPGKNTGDTANVGDAGLSDFYGNTSVAFSTTSGSGTAVYTAAMPWSPAVTCPAVVTTSGKGVYIYFRSITTGVHTKLNTINTQPTLAINGVSIQLSGAQGSLVNTGNHDGMIYILPTGTVINPGDSVTISAPLGWALTDAGLTEAMNNQVVVNKVGLSYVGTDTLPKTLKMGLNFDHLLVTLNGNSWITKNLRYRINSWPNVTAFDATGKPTKMSSYRSDPGLLWPTQENYMDGTAYPTQTGLYAIGWDDLDPVNNPVSFSLYSDSGGVANERQDLKNVGTNGLGQVRVFDIQRTGTTVGTGFPINVYMICNNLNPKFDNLMIYGPGDFTYADGQATVLTMCNPWDICAIARERLANSLGSARWIDGLLGWDLSQMAEPEHLQNMSDHQWNGYKKTWRINFTQARPWTQANSPYCYSSLFGSPFSATLASAITTAPAAGTLEDITISDAATAPVIEGLTLTIDSEICRVMLVTGTTVQIERGSLATTPATHSAGTIQVNNRLAVNTLADWGPVVGNGEQIAELVTQSPHRLRTLQRPTFSGPWPVFTYTDGSTWANTSGGGTYSGRMLGAYVTGANTFVTMFGGNSSVNNVTLASTYTFNPAATYSDILIPDYANLPYEFIARVCGSLDGCNLHVNIPLAASDQMVDVIARRCRDNFPAGRQVIVEYSNEPWNFGYMNTFMSFVPEWLLNKAYANGYHWYNRRLPAIKKRFVDRFNEVNPPRGNEVKAMYSAQMPSAGGTPGMENEVYGYGYPRGYIDYIGLAPYMEVPCDDQPYVQVENICDMDLAIDLFVFHMMYNLGTGNSPSNKVYIDQHKAAVDSYNATYGTNIALYGYEGGPQISWYVFSTTLSAAIDSATTTVPVVYALRFTVGQYIRCDNEWMKITAINGNTLTVLRGQSGSTAAAHAGPVTGPPAQNGATVRNSHLESARDIHLHPNYFIAEQDMYAMWQRGGLVMINDLGYCIDYLSYNTHWGMFHHMGQRPGRGDGSDGKLDNRLTVARPGQPHTKPSNVSLDLNCVSVRGGALLAWNGVSVTPPPPSGVRRIRVAPSGRRVIIR